MLFKSSTASSCPAIRVDGRLRPSTSTVHLSPKISVNLEALREDANAAQVRRSNGLKELVAIADGKFIRLCHSILTAPGQFCRLAGFAGAV